MPVMSPWKPQQTTILFNTAIFSVFAAGGHGCVKDFALSPEYLFSHWTCCSVCTFVSACVKTAETLKTLTVVLANTQHSNRLYYFESGKKQKTLSYLHLDFKILLIWLQISQMRLTLLSVSFRVSEGVQAVRHAWKILQHDAAKVWNLSSILQKKKNINSGITEIINSLRSTYVHIVVECHWMYLKIMVYNF